MFGLTRLGTAIGLGSRDAEAARSLAEALAREPCDKSLIAKAKRSSSPTSQQVI